MVRLIGIDLSTSKKNCTFCQINVDGAGNLNLEKLPAYFDPSVVEGDPNHILENLQLNGDVRTIVAIDVPFGWPVGFSTTVVRHMASDPVSFPVAKHLNEVDSRLRFTERFLKTKIEDLQPLSVSSDKIAATAICGAKLLQQLVKHGFEISLRHSDATRKKEIIEVYPKASLLSWLGKSEALRTYKKKSSTCLEIFMAIRERFNLATPMEWSPKNDDELDSIVAALTASDYISGKVLVPNVGEMPNEVIDREGWIWAPIPFKRCE